MKNALVATATALILCLPAFSAGAVPDSDWNQWLGANRDGISPDTGLLKQWPAGGPPLVWKATGLGSGFSSVSIHGDRIFTMGDLGESSALICLNKSDGKIGWTTNVGKSGGNDGQRPGTRCTPATDGELVFALGQYGELVCAKTTTGKEVWRKHLKDDLGGNVPHWNYSESPLLDGELLVCTPGGNKGAVVALKKETGDLVWQSEKLEGGAEYTSLIAVEISGVRQYIVVTKKTVAGVSAKEGKVLWRGTHPGGTAVITTPVYHDGIVFMTTAYQVGCKAFKITATGTEFKAEAIYSDEASEKKGPKIMDNKGGGVIVLGDYLYGTGDNGQLKCLELKTGKEVWKNACVRSRASLAYADGHFVVRSEGGAGTVALVEATPEGYKETGRFDQPERSKYSSWPHPVVIGGKLYLRDEDNLFCYDVKAK